METRSVVRGQSSQRGRRRSAHGTGRAYAGDMIDALAVNTVNYVREGVVARYTEVDGFKLAVCVGFGRDHRPRVRLYRAQAGKWTQPELVDRTHLVPLTDVEISGASRQRAVLTQALSALWGTPELGFRTADLALLVADEAPETAEASRCDPPRPTVRDLIVALTALPNHDLPLYRDDSGYRAVPMRGVCEAIAEWVNPWTGEAMPAGVKIR